MQKIILIIISILFYGCDSVENEDKIMIEEIKKEWINSTQEFYDEVDEYIPIGYKELPQLRYRQKYKFEDNDICQYYVLDSKDAHHYKVGKWKFNDRDETIIIYDSEDKIIIKYKIEELSENLLKLREIK